MVKTPESLQKFSKSLMELDMTKGVEQVLNQLAELKVPGITWTPWWPARRSSRRACAAMAYTHEFYTGVYGCRFKGYLDVFSGKKSATG